MNEQQYPVAPYIYFSLDTRVNECPLAAAFEQVVRVPGIVPLPMLRGRIAHDGFAIYGQGSYDGGGITLPLEPILDRLFSAPHPVRLEPEVKELMEMFVASHDFTPIAGVTQTFEETIRCLIPGDESFPWTLPLVGTIDNAQLKLPDLRLADYKTTPRVYSVDQAAMSQQLGTYFLLKVAQAQCHKVMAAICPLNYHRAGDPVELEWYVLSGESPIKSCTAEFDFVARDKSLETAILTPDNLPDIIKHYRRTAKVWMDMLAKYNQLLLPKDIDLPIFFPANPGRACQPAEETACQFCHLCDPRKSAGVEVPTNDDEVMAMLADMIQCGARYTRLQKTAQRYCLGRGEKLYNVNGQDLGYSTKNAAGEDNEEYEIDVAKYLPYIQSKSFPLDKYLAVPSNKDTKALRPELVKEGIAEMTGIETKWTDRKHAEPKVPKAKK